MDIKICMQPTILRVSEMVTIILSSLPLEKEVSFTSALL